MEREKKVFLCVQSLLNISKDLRDEYKEYTNMILFIADRIAEAEQKTKKVETSYTLHGDGDIHNLSLDEPECDDGECEFTLEPTEDMMIEKEIDEMISIVRKEMSSVSD